MIDTQREKLVLSAQDERVDIKSIRPYLDPPAYADVLRRVNNHFMLKSICAICDPFVDDDVLQCAFCLTWFHLQCIDRILKPKKKNWFCQSCVNTIRNSRKKSRLKTFLTVMEEVGPESIPV